MPSHYYRCPLRWSDMDAFQHVNNVQYVRYLEDARVAMFLDRPSDDRVFTLEGDVLIVRHEIDYRWPLVYRPEPVQIETWASHLGAASFTLEYEISDEHVIYVRAKSVAASFDAEAGRTRRLTEEQRVWLEKFDRDGN